MHTCLYTYMLIYIHAYIHTCLYTYMLICIQARQSRAWSEWCLCLYVLIHTSHTPVCMYAHFVRIYHMLSSILQRHHRSKCRAWLLSVCVCTLCIYILHACIDLAKASQKSVSCLIVQCVCMHTLYVYATCLHRPSKASQKWVSCFFVQYVCVCTLCIYIYTTCLQRSCKGISEARVELDY